MDIINQLDEICVSGQLESLRLWINANGWNKKYCKEIVKHNKPEIFEWLFENNIPIYRSAMIKAIKTTNYNMIDHLSYMVKKYNDEFLIAAIKVGDIALIEHIKKLLK